jgi:hypothetical protein
MPKFTPGCEVYGQHSKHATALSVLRDAGNSIMKDAATIPLRSTRRDVRRAPERIVRAALQAAVAPPPAGVDAALEPALTPAHAASPDGMSPAELSLLATAIGAQPAHAAADGDDEASDADMTDAEVAQSWGVRVPLGPLLLAQGVAPEAMLSEAQRVATETKKLSPSTADYAAARRTLEQSQCYIAQLAAAAARHRPAEQEALQPAESLEHGAIVIDDEEEVVAPVRVAQPARGTGLSRDTAINLCSDDDEE